MHLTVTGRLSDNLADQDIAPGRCWDVAAYYLYTLAWDPFILSRLKAAPVLREPTDKIVAPADVILLFAHPNDDDDGAAIKQVRKAGGRIVFNRPSPELIPKFCTDGYGQTIISLREHWHLDAASSEKYIYPHTDTFLRLNPGAGTVLSHIGENPDLIVTDKAAVFAGDPIAAVGAYQFTPGRLSGLMSDLGILLVHTIAAFTEMPVSRDEQRKLSRHVELRRDFHSFGFAYMTVLELGRCHGGDNVDVEPAEALVIDAAQSLADGDHRGAAKTLKQAFEELEVENRKLQPVPAVFTDMLHGGELYPEIGYFEIDWPEHPAEVIRTYLQWAKTRSYKFNVDLGATTVRELALRFPQLFSELQRGKGRSHVEFVNGSCNQPYPPFHPLESQIRQFDTGRDVWREVLGVPPKTYASQEFGFCPQLAAVLKQQGYRNAVIRVQNMGDAPTLTDEQIEWQAPSGDKIRSLPSHPHKSEQLNEFTYHNLHLKLYLHQKDDLDFAVFSCFGDITYHRWMREELIRTCHYAPVFGRFETFQGYFRSTKKAPAPDKRLYMSEFDCDASFINLGIWDFYQAYTGNYNSNCINSMRTSSLFAAAELLDAVAAITGNGDYRTAEHERNWEALSHYQGHGTYIVPYFQGGGFQGPGDSPLAKEARRGLFAVAEYLGPTDHRPIKEVTDQLIAAAESRAGELIRDWLKSDADGNAYRFYNFAPACERIISLPGHEDRHVRVSLPAYGCLTLTDPDVAATAGSGADPVAAGTDFLDNGLVRAEFDLERGTLQRLVRKDDGKELLSGASHAFYFPDSPAPVCSNSTVLLRSPLRGTIEFEISVGDACRMTTRVSLDSGATTLTCETQVLEVPPLAGDQWHNHLGVRFELAERGEVWSSHFNVLEPFPHDRIYSPNVLVADEVVFLNEGNQFYIREGTALSNILIMENEPARQFRYAVGLVQKNPIMQARAWAQPCFIERVHAKKSFAQFLVQFDRADIELLSCRYDDGALLLRLANTCDRKVPTSLTMFAPIAAASSTTLAGDHKSNLPVQDGSVALELSPWDIRQVRLTLA